MTYHIRTEFPHPLRYGIIPCQRCAFWEAVDAGSLTVGSCRRLPPTILHSMEFEDAQHYSEEMNRPIGFFPSTYGNEGCGDGLLREDALPLPEPKP